VVKQLLLILAFLLAPLGALSAQEQEANDGAKAEALIQSAIKALGGEKYLGVRTIVTRGQYTPYDKGMPANPMGFVYYMAYPDRERIEFGKGDSKFIQANSSVANWVYEARQKMIRDQTEEQVRRSQQSMRFDLDNLLRAGWKQNDAKLVFIGRREPWTKTFSEALRIDFSDGASVTLHFDTRTKLPLMSEYKIIEEKGAVAQQARYFRWVDYNGIMYPSIQDFYREGQQSARATFDDVRFNEQVPETLFAKPSNIKEVK
jgi:hypothetical protein